MDTADWQVAQISLVDYRALPSLPGQQSLLQSAFWGELKAKFGWSAHYLRLTPPPSPPAVSRVDGGDGGGDAVAVVPQLPLLVLSRRLPLVGGRLLYIPHGPTIPVGTGATSGTTTAADNAMLLRALVRPIIAATCPSVKPRIVRWDPPFAGELPREQEAQGADGHSDMPRGSGGDARQRRPRLSLVRHSVQPRHTIVVDLRRPERELLERMKAKTRYNIRLSERREVVVREAQATDLAHWYALYRDTCVRNRIGRRSLGYFRALLSLGQRTISDARVELLLAYHQRTLLGGVIVAHYSGTATYLFGASANIMRNLMSNYLLQWVAMQRAKEAGCIAYDLFGVSPTGRGHYLSGLYRFKSGFGGAFIQRWGSIDYIAAPLAGRLYRLCERAYFFYHRRIKVRR